MKTKAVLVHAPLKTSCGEVEIPEPAVGQVLIQSAFSCISAGTELRCLRNPGGVAVNQYPYIGGYSMSGIVVRGGKETSIAPGTRVFCGRTDAANVPLQWGAHIGMAVRSESELIPIPDSVSLCEASIAKIAAIAYHGSRFSISDGDNRVAVIGLGPIGQLSARIHAARGANVLGVERIPARLESLRNQGIAVADSSSGIADAVLEVFPGGVDAVVDCTGLTALVPEILSVIKPKPWGDEPVSGGRYVIQGSYPFGVEFPYDAAFQRELSIWFSRDAQRRDIENALGLIANRTLRVSDLLHDVRAPEDAASVFSELMDPDCPRLTSVFNWS
jgi:bacteriochlorophyllide a dehydrogenase